MGNHTSPHTARAVTGLAATLVAAVVLAACGNDTNSGSQQVSWVTDDLHQDPDADRYYTTCERSDNDDYEKEVWLTDEQAAEHTPDAPCPAGEERTAEYLDDDSDDHKVKVVPRPANPKNTTTTRPTTRPTSRPTTRPTPGGPATSTNSGGTSGGTTAGKKTSSGSSGGGTRTGGTKPRR